jgi:branched-chain amino acid transport system permease protein
MTPELLIQLLVSGLGMGFIFALIAIGLALIYGVMGVVNFAHGEFLMMSMYATYFAFALGGLDPLVTLPFVAAAMFLFGVAVYYVLMRRVLGGAMHSQIFATFGLMVFMQAAAQFMFGADYFSIDRSLLSGAWRIAGVTLPTPQVAAAGGALICTVGLYFLVFKTRLGRSLRAVSQDRVAALTMGIDADRINALSWGLAGACVGVAGSLLANFYYVFPRVGGVVVLVAYVTVALGGFGSMSGALIAGIIIGVLQVLSGFFLTSTLKFVPVFVLYLAVVLLRPRGLLGRQ